MGLGVKNKGLRNTLSNPLFNNYSSFKLIQN